MKRVSMKRNAAILLIALIAGCTQSASYKLAPWQTGQWVEYRATAGRNETTAPQGTITIRYSIVGDQTEDGVKYFWFETFGKLDTNNFIFKVMVPERVFGQARRVIIKIGTETAKEMPPELNESPVEYQPPIFDEAKILHAKVKTEKITTPAGVFRCLHARIGTADVWVSSEVPVTGLVRYQSPEQQYELTAFGPTGAQTRITELPERIDLNKIFPKSDSSGK